MELRRLFEQTQRKRDPLVLEVEWAGADALAVLVGGSVELALIESELRRRPELHRLELGALLRELATVPGVGRAAALRYVAARLYRAAPAP